MAIEQFIEDIKGLDLDSAFSIACLHWQQCVNLQEKEQFKDYVIKMLKAGAGIGEKYKEICRPLIVNMLESKFDQFDGYSSGAIVAACHKTYPDLAVQAQQLYDRKDSEKLFVLRNPNVVIHTLAKIVSLPFRVVLFPFVQISHFLKSTKPISVPVPASVSVPVAPAFVPEPVVLAPEPEPVAPEPVSEPHLADLSLSTLISFENFKDNIMNSEQIELVVPVVKQTKHRPCVSCC